MKWHRFPLVVLMVLVFLKIGSLAGAAENPLSWAPADAEFVASLNIRQAADSPIFQRLLREKGGEQAQAKLQVLRNLTGVDLLKDVDRVTIWGRIDVNDSVVALVQGRFNQETLLTLLKVNPKYKVTDRSGLKMHEWFDEKEKRQKYGAFLSDGSILIANQPAGIDAALEAKNGEKGFLKTPRASLWPENHEQLGGWAGLFRPAQPLPNGKLKDTLQAESVWVALTLKPGALSASARVKTNSAETAAQWLDMAKGFLALGSLQSDNAKLRKLAAAAQVAPVAGENAVGVELALTDQELMDIVDTPGKAAGAPKK